ncbi:SDR family NAD(P)-dependent oxidoreductase [Ktedonobacter racemifer]|uniref:Probable oxidoreductase n=1 Tax=Ktedonobacter racemifer DSM 44963 TaxID=485913 RepID=D6TQV6_KTERA|nr:SDR family NAD(P)-dependent oxidoreductase [Ktedonobacter racemifer]EFH85827.1 short-chain dehydrogenase/reductase SDR [Ktedonobacter racemifer DSM 44963]
MAELLTTPFGATTTAMEVIEGIDLRGKRAIITGGSGGIGVETARALAHAGAEVMLAVRNIDAGEQTAEDIRQTTGNQHIHVGQVNLSDLNSVRAFVQGWQGPLDILVNNAGVMAIPTREVSAQGHEMQFATNHLGHFALALGLHDALAAAGHARIVSVSSVGHINGEVDFDDIDFHYRPYDAWVSYGQAKTANVLFAVEAARRWADDGIVANALNPGRIASTNLGRYMKDAPVNSAQSGLASRGVSVKNIEQGAATSVLLAASPLVESVSGRYFEDCNEAGPHQPGIRRGVAVYAIDPDNARRLWNISQHMLNEA